MITIEGTVSEILGYPLLFLIKEASNPAVRAPINAAGGRRHMCEINKFKPECIAMAPINAAVAAHRMRTVEHDRETEYSAKACNHTENQTGSST